MLGKVDELVPRHEGSHHFINIKYGYIVFGLSAVHLGAILAYYKYYNKGGKSQISSLLRFPRLNIPLTLTVVGWGLIIVAIGTFKVTSGEWAIAIKRLGRLAFSLVPFTIFLALKPSFQFVRYLELIGLHKWMSRLVIVTGFVHGVGYMVKWAREGTLTNVWKIWNFLGLVVFLVMLSLIVLSVRYYRRRSYQLFYIVHTITIWLFMCLISLHARPGVWPFTWVCVPLLLYQYWERIASSCDVSELEIVRHESSTLILVRIPKPLLFNWSCGDHVRLNFNLSKLQGWVLPTHPFTIASVQEEPTVDLVMRTPAKLTLEETERYSLTGPFSSFHPDLFSGSKCVVILCGGSGISLGLPFFKTFKQSAVDVSLVWCINNRYDTHVLKRLNVKEPISVYITGNIHQQNSPGEEAHGEEAHGLMGEENDDAIELELMHLLGTKDEERMIIEFNQGRPDLNTIFSLLTEIPSPGNWILASGPQTLVNDAKRWSAMKNVKFASEIYEM